MNALLIVAHGSRRNESNEEVNVLSNKVRERFSKKFPIIRSAFLELADPLIPEGLQQCIDDGACSIDVLPYFLNSGRHVTEDIPKIVNKFSEGTPVEINITPHIGSSVMLIDIFSELTLKK